jgi:putative ABC transport system substrate-binding protein
MRRRDFIALIAGATVPAPGPTWGQEPQKMRRIGVLLGLAENDPEATGRIKAFRLGLRDLGWIEGRNIHIEYRFAGSNLDSIKRHVTALIALAPDVIVANTTPVVATLRPATSTIPIVFVVVNDPVRQGFISSLAQPGANVTGFSFIEPEIVGKWVDLLGDAKPNLQRVGLMFNPDTAPYYDVYLRSYKETFHQSPVEVKAAHIRSVAEVELAIAELGRESNGGLMAAGDPFILTVRGAILKAAEKHRVPIISPYRQFVTEGSLMSYGPDTSDIFRRSASYVDRILKGEHPGKLPAQAPSKFELVVNLKTAKALGLSIPNSFLLLADDVIE